MNPETKKYGIVFIITLGIFIVVFGLVNVLNQKKLANIDDLQRKITADLIATETQFDLLKTAPCGAIENNSILSQELGELGQKLDFAQTSQSGNKDEVAQLKKYYSLLQVKDYLLMQELAGKCDVEIDSLLYFYANDCDDCAKQGYVLTEFKKQYPELRVYSFDTELDFSVIDTFASLYDFEDVYPTLIIGDKVYQELTSLEKLKELFPELVEQSITQERAEKGISYILETQEYSELEEQDVSFIRQIDNIYEFLVEIDGKEAEYIELIFNQENQEFETNKIKNTR